MAVPNYEKHDSYSEDEVQHIVAREVMRHRLDDLDGKLRGLETSMTSMFAKLEAAIQALMANITKSADQIKECREELKREVDREYATKLELAVLEGKVDRMWGKITVAVSLSVAFIQIVLSYFNLA